jgi:hypothetical protein
MYICGDKQIYTNPFYMKALVQVTFSGFHLFYFPFHVLICSGSFIRNRVYVNQIYLKGM